MTNFYDRHILPPLLDATMKQRLFTPMRAAVGAAAVGRVLEIGIGSGLNLRFYGTAVSGVTGVEPSAALLRMAQAEAARLGVTLDTNACPAEALPFADGSFDTVVTTWTLCTIADPVAAMREARRVLAPGGRLLFAEHGLSPDAGVARWQNRITPVWRCIGGGCHLNRPIARIIEQAGLRVDRLKLGYTAAPRIFGYMYEGAASAA